MTSGVEARRPPADLADVAARLAADPVALQEAYTLLAPTVLAYLRRLVPPADTEDVLQLTFTDVWRSRERYDPGRPLVAWVLGIARLRALDLLRTRRAVAGLDDVPEPVGPVLDDDLADRFARADLVRRALEELPREQRQVLLLAYFDDLTQTQIADWLDVPLGTVKARSSRGLRRLAQLLGEGS